MASCSVPYCSISGRADLRNRKQYACVKSHATIRPVLPYFLQMQCPTDAASALNDMTPAVHITRRMMI